MIQKWNPNMSVVYHAARENRIHFHHVFNKMVVGKVIGDIAKNDQ